VFHLFARSLYFIYQVAISPLLGKNCRFEPTCSCYAKDCIKQHNFFYALWLVIKRLAKCQPFYKKNQYIFDPVPQKKKVT
jgi:putative membrane protein insertion efficiency factor